MEITELVWNLFVIFVPGVVATLIIRYITTSRQFTVFEFLIYSAILGIAIFAIMEICCSLYWIVLSVFDRDIFLVKKLNLSIWRRIFSSDGNLNEYEMYLSYLLAIPMGILIGFITSRKVLIRLLQWLHLTSRYGDNDVWSFYLNSPNTKWIFLHDKNENLTYYGKIRAFSDSLESREILLEEVSVYVSDSWQELYCSDAIYLDLRNKEFKIETPKPLNNETD